MGRWAPFSNPPMALLVGAILVLVGSQAPKWLARARRGRISPREAPNRRPFGRLILYVGFGILFLLDFFLFLRRDGFRASWSATFLMMLAAFVVGEAVGRWNSSRTTSDDDRFNR